MLTTPFPILPAGSTRPAWRSRCNTRKAFRSSSSMVSSLCETASLSRAFVPVAQLALLLPTRMSTSTKESQPGGAAIEPSDAKKSGARHALLAAFLGWTFAAFDFFVVVFLYDTLAHQFVVPKKSIVFTVTATPSMPPLGALLFSLLPDR